MRGEIKVIVLLLVLLVLRHLVVVAFPRGP